jgi:hypothetical protein
MLALMYDRALDSSTFCRPRALIPLSYGGFVGQAFPLSGAASQSKFNIICFFLAIASVPNSDSLFHQCDVSPLPLLKASSDLQDSKQLPIERVRQANTKH